MRVKMFEPGALSFRGTPPGNLVTQEASQSPSPEGPSSRRTGLQKKKVRKCCRCTLPYSSVFGIYHLRTLRFSCLSMGQPCLPFSLHYRRHTIIIDSLGSLFHRAHLQAIYQSCPHYLKNTFLNHYSVL